MAKLSLALKATFGEEGVWSDGKGKNSSDSGGRTYKGIAETANPHWSGWIIINQHLNDKNFPQCLEQNIELQNLVEKLYTTNYWSEICGDKLINQLKANDLFDTAVNFGTNTAIKMIQESVAVKSTGIMDIITINKLNQLRV
jgi:lysozyme family protein